MYGRGYGSSGFGFGPAFTPPLIINLMLANLAVFVADFALGRALSAYGTVSAFTVWRGAIWQPFTYMWLHGSLLHLAFNMLTLWMFGSTLVMAWGAQRFLRFYLLCGVGAGLILATVPYLLLPIFSGGIYTGTVGASGAIFGVLVAYSLTWPDRVIALIFPPVTFRVIWMVPIFFLMNVISDTNGSVSHLGHFGGIVVGWLYMRQHGGTGVQQISWAGLKHRLHRWRMRRRLKAIQYEEWEERRRNQDRRFH